MQWNLKKVKYPDKDDTKNHISKNGNNTDSDGCTDILTSEESRGENFYQHKTQDATRHAFEGNRAHLCITQGKFTA